MKKEFYPHQKKAFHYSMVTRHPAYFMEMRLGKTLPCIRRCKLYKPRTPELGLRALVAAPNSALGSWERECKSEGVDIKWLTGTKRARQDELRDAMTFSENPTPTFCLMNKEGWMTIPEIKDCPWDAVVIDESTGIKEQRAKITKFFMKYFRGSLPHRWILTGTPDPEGAQNYFCQLKFLDGRAFGRKDYWGFRQAYMEPPYIGHDWVFQPGAVDHIRREVGRRAFVLRRKDVDLEENKVRERREFEFPTKLRKAYDKLESEFVLDYKETSKKTIWSGARYQWMRQICGGCIDMEMIWDGKLQDIIELLEGELAKQQVVIWCAYNPEIKAIYETLSALKISVAYMIGATKPTVRRQMEAAFLKGKPRVMILQVAIGNFGLNLSSSDVVMYHSSPVAHLMRVQTEDRIVTVQKAKDKRPLLYIDFVVKDSIDEDALLLLAGKKKSSDLNHSRALACAIRERKSWV